MSAKVVSTRAALRQALGHARPGLVPTMGALHDGHRALIARSASENIQTVVSIFVNPAQFERPTDLARYPRHLEADVAFATDAGATLIFAPPVHEMYPAGFDTWVEPGELANRWEGALRPGHFRGVATVVTILLNLVQPARAYFGEKDFQQLQIVRRLRADLLLPGEIVGCETVRDEDGLAMSSRNERLSPENRRLALAVPRALELVACAVTSGELASAKLLAIARETLEVPGIVVDYVTIVDEQNLQPVESIAGHARLLVAAEIDSVRLIDNLAIRPPGS